MDEGIGLIDFSNLPPRWRAVLQLILREHTLSYDALETAFAALPDPDRIAADDLRAIVAELCDRQWLVRAIIDDRTVYKVNLRRQTGRNQMAHVWDALGLEETNKEETPPHLRRGANRPLPKKIWNSLSDAAATQTARAVRLEDAAPDQADETQSPAISTPHTADNPDVDETQAPSAPFKLDPDDTHAAPAPDKPDAEETQAPAPPKPRRRLWESLSFDSDSDGERRS